MSPARAVIFDLDGCLVDSEPLSLGAIAAEMRALGIADATAAEIGERLLGIAMPEIADYVAARLGAPVPDDFAIRVETQLLAAYQTGLRPMSGAKKLLGTLHDRGIGMAIATGGTLQRMAVTLELSGLVAWFRGTACSVDEVALGKPAPDLFMLALERLRLDRADCVVLEDSPNGVAGARAAGIQAIGFVGGGHLAGRRAAHGRVLRDAGATAVFETLEDVGRFVLTRDRHTQ